MEIEWAPLLYCGRRTASRYCPPERPPQNRSEGIGSPGERLFSPAIEACDAKGIGSPTGFTKARLAHPLEHYSRLWKAFHGRGQIGIRPTDAGNQCSHGGQHVAKIETIDLAQQTFGFTEIQDPALSSRLQDSQNLSNASIVVGEISEAECGGHQVKSLTGKRKSERIGLNPAQGCSLFLPNGPCQHRVRKVDSENCRVRSSLFVQREGHVAGPATQVQNLSAGKG